MIQRHIRNLCFRGERDVERVPFTRSNQAPTSSRAARLLPGAASDQAGTTRNVPSVKKWKTTTVLKAAAKKHQTEMNQAS